MTNWINNKTNEVVREVKQTEKQIWIAGVSEPDESAKRKSLEKFKQEFTPTYRKDNRRPYYPNGYVHRVTPAGGTMCVRGPKGSGDVLTNHPEEYARLRSGTIVHRSGGAKSALINAKKFQS